MRNLFIVLPILVLFFINEGLSVRCGPDDFLNAEAACVDLKDEAEEVYATCRLIRMHLLTDDLVLDEGKMKELLDRNSTNTKVVRLIVKDFSECADEVSNIPSPQKGADFFKCLSGKGSFLMMTLGYNCQKREL